MTPADEARFIAPWQAGTETAAIAQQLGIPPGTARSRAYALQQAGKIAPRPKGGRRTRTDTPAPAPAPTRGSTSSSGPCGSPKGLSRR